jgi:metal-responsive CopG/Arc/MetJ family transcriptional regulator
MPGRAKIAVTLDPGVLARAERLRRRSGESRSALVNRALRALLDSERRADQVKQYLEAYERVPETPAEIAAADELSRKTLRALAWDDEE